MTVAHDTIKPGQEVSPPEGAAGGGGNLLNVILALALVAAAIGASGVVAGAFGEAAPQAIACSGAGGNC